MQDKLVNKCDVCIQCDLYPESFISLQMRPTQAFVTIIAPENCTTNCGCVNDIILAIGTNRCGIFMEV